MKTKILTTLLFASANALCIANEANESTPLPPETEIENDDAILCDDRDEYEQQVLRLDIQARVDYQMVRQGEMALGSNDYTGLHIDNAQSGFRGKYLVIRADGEIVKGLTYSWRQRLNTLHEDANFFNATDWVYLNYNFRGWNFQVGKEVIAIGGYEYDRAPIDLYACSVFWNNIPCYALGASVGYDVSKNDRLTFQVVQSPFFTKENRNMYGYSLMWNGHHSFFDAIYSVNLFEYKSGEYINYISLGNKFTYKNVSLEFDFMNRAASHQTFFFKDMSVMGELSWRPTRNWNVFGKITYDINKSGTAADVTVLDGTKLTMVGGGLEYYPLRKGRHSLRLHADCFYSWGFNANDANIMQGKTLFFSAGITWDMNLLNLKINRKSKKKS